jgi:hypothetical protein
MMNFLIYDGKVAVALLVFYLFSGGHPVAQCLTLPISFKMR